MFAPYINHDLYFLFRKFIFLFHIINFRPTEIICTSAIHLQIISLHSTVKKSHFCSVVIILFTISTLPFCVIFSNFIRHLYNWISCPFSGAPRKQLPWYSLVCTFSVHLGQQWKNEAKPNLEKLQLCCACTSNAASYTRITSVLGNCLLLKQPRGSVSSILPIYLQACISLR